MVGEPKTHREKMNKQIVGIIMGIFLISLASALTYNITAGESTSFIIPGTFDYYSIVGNQSEVNLNITQEGLNITITLDKYSQSDSFELIFFNSEKEIIHHYSGGGGSTIYKDRNITTYVDKIIYKTNETEVIKIVPGEKQKFPWVFYLTVIGVLSAILIIVLTVEHLKSKKENEK